MNPFKAAAVWYRIRKLESAVGKEVNMGYDIKIGAAKAIRDLVITSLAVICSYFAVPENLASVLKDLPGPIAQAAIPLFSAFFVFALNWVKERNK